MLQISLKESYIFVHLDRYCKKKKSTNLDYNNDISQMSENVIMIIFLTYPSSFTYAKSVQRVAQFGTNFK